jgi:hypothetical protein
MLQDTSIAPFLLAELVAALQPMTLTPSSGGCMAAFQTLMNQPWLFCITANPSAT